ncbi:hypothetical protein Kpol_513p5 [Vanderwaltozyma polyspora DSM 70294]|uniref:Antagonist of mitotic exit network protein 1 n=1 Tax=Vanderwaltozyma polyspora (strain ATCC 22028 / DSM 70294 / BCRC 21397 / CBS 2163 / NBRC 10782 / NRRL Y-8283 / UCD 57-17) TaxID=436907 RepID=A7TMJ1_VANPO|nr:uncharacterized protein Kpol_513p5 [Vanderwaltozyma polyspora DSM 70294]EDO16489.1 hypothetical protein Kpol_513p5 [Vanderwaltozyma polyspora DSM 70294]
MKFFSRFVEKRKREAQHVDLVNYRPLKKKSSDESLSKDYINNLKKKIDPIETSIDLVNGLPTPNSSPLRNQSNSLENDFSQLNIVNQSNNQSIANVSFINPSIKYEHEIFQMPEILEKIIGFVKEMDDHEANQSSDAIAKLCGYRRKPQSYKHSLMIYKDQTKAKRVWDACNNQTDSFEKNNFEGSLHNCLKVCKLWYSITNKHLTEHLTFEKDSRLQEFLMTYNGTIRPKSLKFKSIKARCDLRSWTHTKLFDLSNTTHLEFSLCSTILPPISWFDDLRSLKSLIILGNKNINDEYLIQISSNGKLKYLETLDLRACDQISDAGIVAIATNCPNLKYINIGRHKNGHIITSLSVAALAKYTSIETLGIAGCDVTDIGIWELANLCGNRISRLSLNNCNSLTNRIIPIICKYGLFPKLAVLEIRNISQIENTIDLVHYKNWKKYSKLPFLIESCERITSLIINDEEKLKKLNSLTALRDMTHWVNDPNDENTNNE